MKVRYAVAVGVAVLALAGCSAKGSTTTKPATAAPWAPTGYTEYGDVAYRWTSSGFACKSYQDNCFGVTVVARDGCPDGVYIELAVLDANGAVVDKANEITAGITNKDVAQAVLSPPGGAPKNAKARVTKLNCL